MTNSYKKVYTEVVEILSHLSNEEYSKIPVEKIEFYRKNMDLDYAYKINPEIELSKQNISKETNAIIVSLFRDYFANESQKEKLNELLNKNQEKEEKAKREKYRQEDLFKKNNILISKYSFNKEEIETTYPSVIKKESSFFKKFIAYIHKLIFQK